MICIFHLFSYVCNFSHIFIIIDTVILGISGPSSSQYIGTQILMQIYKNLRNSQKTNKKNLQVSISVEKQHVCTFEGIIICLQLNCRILNFGTGMCVIVLSSLCVLSAYCKDLFDALFLSPICY